jgi:hypothetical protein
MYTRIIVIAVAREGREAAQNWKTMPNDGARLRKAVEDLAEHVGRLTAQVEELVQETTLAPLVKALQVGGSAAKDLPCIACGGRPPGR